MTGALIINLASEESNMARLREGDREDILEVLTKLSGVNRIGARVRRNPASVAKNLGPDVSLIRNVAVQPIFAFNYLLLF